MPLSSSKNSKKKDLYLAKNMAELNKMVELPAKLTTKAKMLAKTADKIFKEALYNHLMKDEERAYVFFMKYIDIVIFIKKTADYRKDKTDFENLLDPENRMTAINTAEELSGSLKERYALMETETVAKELTSLEHGQHSTQQIHGAKADNDSDEAKKKKKKEDDQRTNEGACDTQSGSQSAGQPYQPSSYALPSHWEPMVTDEYVRKVPLKTTEDEFQTVSHHFLQELNNRKIISIVRVQSKFLWQHLCVKRRSMEEMSGHGDIREMNLFHGTNPKILENICTENLDVRLSGTNAGAALGEGTYFATNAKTADHYASPDPESGHRFMLQCRVLVGKWTKGDRGLRRPPKIPSDGCQRLYDSCVDNVLQPSIFCVFDHVQYYPEYIIKYE